MTPGEVRLPLRPGESAPQFAVPRADQEGAVCLDDFHGRPVLLTLMRGLHCPFCRRNIAMLGRIAPALQSVGVEMLAIVGTTAERARLYFRYRPASITLGADPDLATHRRYGIPCYPVTPELLDQLRTVRVDPFRELPEPIPFLGPGEKEIHDVFDRLDGFVPNETDQRDRTRQFRDSLQLCGQYMLDGTGTIRWAHVEGGSVGLAASGVFPNEATLLAVARGL